MLRSKKGFTLIELIVVMAIIGILVLLAAPKFLGYTKDAHVATMLADAKVISNAALIYNIETEGAWPVAEDEVKNEDGEVVGTVDVVVGKLAIDNKGVFSVELSDEEGFKVEDGDYTLYELDSDKLYGHIKSIKNGYDSYGIITDVGEYEGEVVFIGNDGEGLANRAGDIWFGVGLENKLEN